MGLAYLRETKGLTGARDLYNYPAGRVNAKPAQAKLAKPKLKLAHRCLGFSLRCNFHRGFPIILGGRCPKNTGLRINTRATIGGLLYF